jgi:hypothetical protein
MAKLKWRVCAEKGTGRERGIRGSGIAETHFLSEMPPRKRRKISTEEESKARSVTREETKSSCLEAAKSRHPICGYAEKPADHFKKRHAEIMQSEGGGEELIALFSRDIYLPKDLVDLCLAYYDEPLFMVIDRMIDDLQQLRNAGGIKTLMNDLFAICSDGERIELNSYIESLDPKISQYLWWFRMRKLIPAFISIDEVHHSERPSGDPCRVTMVEFGQQLIIEIWFDCGSNQPFFRRWRRDTHHRWDNSIWAITNVTFYARGSFKQISKLRPRPGEFQHDALHNLVALAAVQIWCSDASHFAHLPNPSKSQENCHRVWNEAYKYYDLGPPFSLL